MRITEEWLNYLYENIIKHGEENLKYLLNFKIKPLNLYFFLDNDEIM